MTRIFFTSDPHFGHRLVAGHRGFEDTDQHDAAIAQRWYATVLPKDQVWVLGDICVSSPDYALNLLKQLPGEKHLIAGNHDPVHPMHRQSHKYLPRFLEVFASVQAFARRRIDGQDVLLSHFPYARDRGEARYTQYRLMNEGRWLLHGHTHGTEKVSVTRHAYPGALLEHEAREIHVGMDAWDLTPVPLDVIVTLMREESV